MPTVLDVAKRAGVAPITVSRVINNSGYISEATRKRVQAAVKELGYVPNTLARGLRSKQTRTLALVVTDITNPYFTLMARGVEDVAEIERQCAHHGGILMRDLTRERIEIRYQAITQMQILDERVIDRVTGISKVPDFARRVRPMCAEHWQKRTVLKPARIQLTIACVLDAVVVIPAPEPQLRVSLDEKRSNVQRPVGQAGHAKIQPGRNLLTQRFPVRRKIA